MTDKLNCASVFADDRPTSCGDDLYQWVLDAEDLIHKLHSGLSERDMEIDRLKSSVSKLNNDLQRIANAFDGVMVGDDITDKVLELLKSKATPPKGYALISEGALRSWGKLEEVRAMCVYPIGDTQEKSDPVLEMLAKQKAKKVTLLAQGKCPECGGEGECGGQFTGGSWPCEDCHGTGKFPPKGE